MSHQPRILPPLLLLGLGLLAGGEAGAASRLQGTILQLSGHQASWSDERWSELFARFESLGLHQLVVQWSVYEESAFYPSQAFSPLPAPALGKVLDLAQGSGMEVLVGLAYDPGFESAIRRDPELVEVYLRRLRLRSLAAARELEADLGERPSFAGWYLPEEIDDVHWLEPERRRLLIAHLADLTSSLRQLTPRATLAISGFSNAHADPETLESFWRQLLEGSSLDRVLFQDGVGAGKQRLDDLPLYLGAVERAAAAASRQLQVVVEVFRQVDGPPIDDLPFRAVPAPPARVRRQLAIAARHAPAGLLVFSVPEYLTPAAGEAAARLYRSLLPAGDAWEPEPETPSEAAGGRSANDAPATPAEPAIESLPEVADSPAGAEGTREAPGARPAGRIYELQLALFHHRGNAERFVDEWTGRGYRPYLVEVLSSQGETRYTVRIGPYPSIETAAEAAAELRRAEDTLGVIRYRTVA